MEMESRRREIARRKRKKQRQLRRRLAGGAALIAVGLAAFVCVELRNREHERYEGAEATSEPLEADHSERDRLVLHVADVEHEGAAGLPECFDLRDVYDSLQVPDQGAFQTCWAFASLKALETTVKDGTELSADHMTMRNHFGLGQDAGGDYSMASAYLLAWQGPVAEADDPYGDGDSPEDAEPVYHVQELQILGTKDPEVIKEAVYEYGGVQSACYMPQEAGAERERYYREETGAFYYSGIQESNHDVVIIGWDDAYPKENFAQQPEADGAFLCMNTWGQEFGDSGYFYISYEDSRIGETSVVYTGIEAADNYDRVYQTDLCGWTGQIGYGTSRAWFANVYEAEEALELAAAGFYATVPETAYRVSVKSLEAGETIGASGWMQAAEGSVGHAGYYTVRFEVPFPVESGKRFVVMIEIDSPGTAEPIAMEYRSGSRLSKVDIDDGEGYISSDGVTWERTETEYNCNVCLKAYATVK